MEILPFYICMCTINEDRMIYGSRNIRCDRYKFLSFWANVCPFSPLTMWKINILKLKKNPGDIIILHICTINYNHMMYFYWDIEHDRENFFVILDCFLSFYPPMDPENQNFEKMKQMLGDIILHMCTINDSYNVWLLRYEAWQTEFFVILDHFLYFYPFDNPKSQHFEKMKKDAWRYHYFTQVYQKSWWHAILFLRYGMQRM